jgi:hypothetical protein
MEALEADLASARRIYERLINAARNVEPGLSVAPIRALIEQGCNLDADILPVIACEVAELPRPLRNWGVKWLADEILSARDRRLGALGAPSEAPKAALGTACAAVQGGGRGTKRVASA